MQFDPKWDRRFLEMARLVSTWSKDPSSKIGSVVVRPDRTVASVGFNGFARGLPDYPQLYADREVKIATVIHAEENAILSAHERLAGCTIYVSGLPPCAGCASKIIQAGIARVVAFDKVVPARWARNMLAGAGNLLMARCQVDLFDEAGGGFFRLSQASGLMVEGGHGISHNHFTFREKIG